ncbi:hypothetical protein [Paenibacillus sp. Aloe-11]|uniref:hypothetical protein n=1 Tax=Paenibacillus sp. Aloe-11 TaxID=1050222 RepID=UPI0005C45A87|nr:hypothetical protein [Paenibacillus sp. Aloe-11]
MKRLQIFEELYQLMLEAEKISYTLEHELEKDVVTEQWTEIVFKISDYLDTNFIYVNEEIIAHCMITLVGFEEILFDEQRSKRLYEFRTKLKETKYLIRNVSGISATENTIRKVANIKVSTDYIKYFRQLKRKHDQDQKKNRK